MTIIILYDLLVLAIVTLKLGKNKLFYQYYYYYKIRRQPLL